MINASSIKNFTQLFVETKDLGPFTFISHEP